MFGTVLVVDLQDVIDAGLGNGQRILDKGRKEEDNERDELGARSHNEGKGTAEAEA